MDKKVIGYIFAVIGLGILIFGAGNFNVPLFSSLNSYVTSIAGMVLVGLGVVFVIMSGGGGRGRSRGYEGKKKSKSGGKIQDLPVYEGDDIIAYRRD